MIIHKDFFCKAVWLLVSMIKLLRTKFVSLKRKNMSVFIIVEKIRWVGTPPGPRKRQTKFIQADEEAPGWVQFEPLTQTVQFSLQEFFIHFSLTGYVYIFCIHFSLHYPFCISLPHHLSNDSP